MTVSTIHTESTEKLTAKSDRKIDAHGTLAILAALSIVREALLGSQIEMSKSYDAFVEVRGMIQDKLADEFKKVLELKKDAIEKMRIAEILTGVAMTLFIASFLTPAGLAAKHALLAAGKSVTSSLAIVAGGFGSVMSIIGNEIMLRVADHEERNTKDQGLLTSNSKIAEDLADKVVETVKTTIKSTEAITEIINSMGAAMQIASK